MKVITKGRTLKVVKSVRTMSEWQNQSGQKMPWLASDEGQLYALAFLVFCAEHNAGMEPKWDDVINTDIAEWEFIQEPGDERQAGDAPVPQNSLATSGEGDGEGVSKQGKAGSGPSKKPKAGSKTK